MKRLLSTLAVGTALAAAPASADTPFTPNSFTNLAHVFIAADMDNDSALSPREYSLLRTGLIDSRWVRDYRGDDYDRMVPTVVRSFAQLDRDNDATISRSEFMNVANDPVYRQWEANSADRWDWAPEYITLTYYLMANPVDTDTFVGQPVENLDGEEIGTVQGVARHQDNGDYYALVGFRGRTADPTPTRYRGRVIGVPLEDILLASNGTSLMLTHRGEEYLMDADGMSRVEPAKLTKVETLHRI